MGKLSDLCDGKKTVRVDTSERVRKAIDYPSWGFFGWGDNHPHGVKRKKLKCPKCGRKVWSSVEVCHDGCCLFHTLPPHKPKGWWKRKKKKSKERWLKSRQQRAR